MKIDEINKSIEELERSDTTFANCQKLSWLYIVRDHNMRKDLGAAPKEIGTSDFMKAAAGADVYELLKILDEHMDVVQLLHPKEYESLISKIIDIKA